MIIYLNYLKPFNLLFIPSLFALTMQTFAFF